MQQNLMVDQCDIYTRSIYARTEAKGTLCTGTYITALFLICMSEFSTALIVVHLKQCVASHFKYQLSKLIYVI